MSPQAPIGLRGTESQRVVAVVQARMSSSRLPGKVLMELAGVPVLQRVVDRLRQATTIDEIVVATSDDASDDTVAAWCEANSVSCFRGSLGDVLSRHVGAAATARAGHVVRIPADKPLVDPALVDAVVIAHLNAGAAYTANIPRDHPDVRFCPLGFEVEVAAAAALELADDEATTPAHREHVMPFLYEQPERFKTERVRAGDFSTQRCRLRLTLDEPADYEVISAALSAAGEDTSELLLWLDANPDVAARNIDVIQRTSGSVAP